MQKGLSRSWPCRILQSEDVLKVRTRETSNKLPKHLVLNRIGSVKSVKR